MDTTEQDWRKNIFKFSLCILPWVDGHDVSVNDSHGAPSRCSYKVTMYFEDGTFSEQSLGEVLTRQLSGGLCLLIPISRLRKRGLTLGITRSLLHVPTWSVPACYYSYHGIVFQMRARTTSMVTGFATLHGPAVRHHRIRHLTREASS